MFKKGVPKTEEEKKKIGSGNKGIHLNKTNNGTLVYKDGKKLCPTCEEWKLLSEYHKRPERPLGVKPKCKSCSKLYRAQNPKMVRFAMYKHAAKRRGLQFDITKDEFEQFWQNPCHYCGDEILTIGLDRVDSSKGYSMENIVPCCATCNTMKLAIPRTMFIQHCYKVVNHTERPD